MQKLYYVAPSDEVFEDVKEQAIKLWHLVDTDNDKFGYATEKCDRIKDIGNIKDNFMYIWVMFDYNNIERLKDMVSKETLSAFNERVKI